MKKLSVLTILFLPGAFVASVFDAGMFEFRHHTQMLWVYFVVVVPLTGFLMLGWAYWLGYIIFAPKTKIKDAEVGRKKE
jgi:hypothetical protein